MARANRNTLHRSRFDMDRQQRQEQPEVPGATGTPENIRPKVAEVKARKRRGRARTNRRQGLSRSEAQ
jgi:hypothetical protein